MRFHGVGLVAAAAVLALSAGSVLAATDVLDQHQDAHDAPSAGSQWDAADYPTAQTFTAGVSGYIDGVWLWGMTTGWSIKVEIRDGGPAGALLGTSSIASPATADDWFDAAFNPTVQVTALSQYAIVITDADGAARIGGTCTANAYSGGQALVYQASTWQPIAADSYFNPPLCMTDFAFRTYEASAPTQTTMLHWDKTQVAAGATTPLTLTETITFAGCVAVDGAAAPAQPCVGVDYTVKQDALPAWFHVTQVDCSTQIAGSNCTLANVAVNGVLPLTWDDNPVVVTLTGTASPDASLGGHTGTATAEGCMTPVVNPPVAGTCVAGSAVVAVGASTVTAPPTSTGGSLPSNGATPLLALLLGLPFGLLGLVAVGARRRGVHR